jgi:uncharacterized SAM-binding protein YcdF (DUF218 family)
MTWYSPLLLLMLALLVLVVASFTSRRRLAILGLVLVLPAYGLMTPLGANLLVLAVEHRVKAAEQAPACADFQAVVLLSGGLDRPAATVDDFAALTSESLSRLFAWQAQAENEAILGKPLIIAGGGPFRIPEAEVLAALMGRLDPMRAPWLLETRSGTTLESAMAVRRDLPPGYTRIALVSSALHLPRARLAFERAGFEVCPWPLYRHYLSVRGWSSLLPQSSSLAKSEMALHEWLASFITVWCCRKRVRTRTARQSGLVISQPRLSSPMTPKMIRYTATM